MPTREDAVARYRDYLKGLPELQEMKVRRELRGTMVARQTIPSILLAVQDIFVLIQPVLDLQLGCWTTEDERAHPSLPRCQIQLPDFPVNRSVQGYSACSIAAGIFATDISDRAT